MNAQKEGKAWYKKWWVWVIVVVVIIGIGGASNKGSTDTATQQSAPAATQEEPKPAERAKWDVEANYAKINNGMTKPEVEVAVGKKSDSCTENTSEYIGKTESCNYGSFGDNGIIVVTYSNDKVSSKTKSKF